MLERAPPPLSFTIAPPATDTNGTGASDGEASNRPNADIPEAVTGDSDVIVGELQRSKSCPAEVLRPAPPVDATGLTLVRHGAFAEDAHCDIGASGGERLARAPWWPSVCHSEAALPAIILAIMASEHSWVWALPWSPSFRLYLSHVLFAVRGVAVSQTTLDESRCLPKSG
eukprot:gnl/TRDRNA2_/TRDRNA2_168770_c1_seq2.p1 gnl/TRDRNA2_/TRDRNA2_168770_c1~~gnl/TRDRNA2_/TRDRNA2_168770_c1_seq2.p1  ORF type:complete len:171 (+),score=25.89 gnl/TRDRNA2_/TRDRNA2_168770_c1_seq2:196-708(+)